MTSTPLTTIAEALIEFILSLLRDPSAAATFAADPERTLEQAGLADVCAADVRAVMPVVVDHPHVVVRPPAPEPPVIVYHQPVAHRDPEVIKQITSVAHNYQIDNRSTIVDQSVNQNIWSEGDVLQVFDQEAVLAVGDQSVAAGDDGSIDNSENDVSMGDVSVGNTTTDVAIDDSFNDESTDIDTEVASDIDESFNDQSETLSSSAVVADSHNTTTTVAVESAVESDVESDAESEAESDAGSDPLDVAPADDDFEDDAPPVELEPPLDDDLDQA